MSAKSITVTFICTFVSKAKGSDGYGKPCGGQVNTSGDRSGFTANCGKCNHPHRVTVKG